LTEVVVDASVALAWCFPDEGRDYADSVLVAPEGRAVLPPAIWSLAWRNACDAGRELQKAAGRAGINIFGVEGRSIK